MSEPDAEVVMQLLRRYHEGSTADLLAQAFAHFGPLAPVARALVKHVSEEGRNFPACCAESVWWSAYLTRAIRELEAARGVVVKHST